MSDFWQTTALLVLIACSIGIGFAIGCADRKWWRGPKPPQVEEQAPTADEIADAVYAKMDARWATVPNQVCNVIEASIQDKLPGKAEFEASVATMVRTAAEALQTARNKSGKRNRRGKA